MFIRTLTLSVTSVGVNILAGQFLQAQIAKRFPELLNADNFETLDKKAVISYLKIIGTSTAIALAAALTAKLATQVVDDVIFQNEFDFLPSVKSK